MTFWHHFLGLERVCGSAEALRLARASCAAVDEIGRFCDEHAIDADYRHDGWFWTATNARAGGRMDEHDRRRSRRHGAEPFAPVDPEELAARTGSGSHLAGVFEPTSATVQPALLARGLLRVARERGVEVFEHSPMVALERSAPAGRAHTGRHASRPSAS